MKIFTISIIAAVLFFGCARQNGYEALFDSRQWVNINTAQSISDMDQISLDNNATGQPNQEIIQENNQTISVKQTAKKATKKTTKTLTKGQKSE